MKSPSQRKSFLPNLSDSLPTTGISGTWEKAKPEKASAIQMPLAPMFSANLGSRGLTMPMPAMLISSASQTMTKGLLFERNRANLHLELMASSPGTGCCMCRPISCSYFNESTASA
jgi:hypothetical protein